LRLPPKPIGKLAATSVSPLIDGETAFFSGYDGPVGEGKKPFLVRAVFGNQSTGGYSVLRHGTDLFIRHVSLGGNPAPCHKGALVLTLDFMPGEVYVVMSSAR